ncbi:MAG TPA: PVC-type heme-binding CxxCH protein [Flavitalea sp.]|nr:PVC-type heme-binding CxxCH protein [Flavitalea sp.]
MMPRTTLKTLSLFLKITTLPLIAIFLFQCQNSSSPHLLLKKGAHIILTGNNLGSRMINYAFFETEMQLRYPDSLLYFRNMCDGGETPGFRPHSSRNSPWAFPGAEKYQTELATNSGSEGFFDTPDQLLSKHKADIMIAFYGYNESFQGEKGLNNYKLELDSFIKYTLKQKYNGVSAPQLAIVSPIAFEDLSKTADLPDGKKENQNLSLYTKAMKEVAANNNVIFLDAYTPSKEWFDKADKPLTIDGSQLNAAGYEKFAMLLADKLFGDEKPKDEKNRQLVFDAVTERDWMWLKDFKIPNGVHVYGRRYNPFGPDNYPAEIKKIRQMTEVRDEAIWKAVKGEKVNLKVADSKTDTLPTIKTNFDPKENGSLRYLYGEEALSKFHMAPGYKIELFASEAEFPDLANPVQLSFDNKGRLWVATMPTYPQYKPGDGKPNDKLIILEDTDNNGKADKQTIFADSLHLPLGFEFAPEGVYVSQGTNFMLFTDTNGDDKADVKEIILSGFDDHDTHHAHHAYTTDPSGAIYMGEGVFLHTNVETSYGPVRGTNGGFYRYSPQRHQLERTAQLSIPNPWGIAFDDWGEQFFCETSGPDVRWMMPGTVKPRYGEFTHKSYNLIEEKHRVRPTSGLEFVSSRHFPDNVQGDLLINNTIGFLGTKQHTIEDDGTGYKSRHRQDLLWSEDRNFRPVDMEFAPDGSLYVIDWHNILIGHMQHNARDPLRDHVHGRVYRVTYPSRPLVKPAQVAGASINQLFENLKLPEYRTRYRTRRELRGRNINEVLSVSKTWQASLDKNDPHYEHNLLEALWVSWGLNKVDDQLLRKLLHAKDYRVRAAAVRVLRYTGHQVADQAALMTQAALDEHGRVRLEAITAASWLQKDAGLAVLDAAAKKPMDQWIVYAYETARAHLNDQPYVEKVEEESLGSNLKGKEKELYIKGKEIYSRDGYCGTCHQPDGGGLVNAGFPPLKGSDWVKGAPDRLIKVALHGLQGPMHVNGKKYDGQVPMTAFGKMLNDEELAAVLTYVRNAFDNKHPAVSPEKVKQVREATKSRTGVYSAEEILKEHPVK